MRVLEAGLSGKLLLLNCTAGLKLQWPRSAVQRNLTGSTKVKTNLSLENKMTKVATTFTSGEALL